MRTSWQPWSVAPRPCPDTRCPAPLDGVPFGRAVLVVNHGVTMGRVYTPAGNYSIRGTERYQSVERLPAAPPGCAADGPACPAARQGSVPHPHPHAEPPGPLGAGTEARPTGPLDPVRPEAAGDHALERHDEPDASVAAGSAAAEEGSVVDVLVVYPSFVRDLEGGYGAMLAIIDLDFATANEAYAASGIELPGQGRGGRGSGVREVPRVRDGHR